MFGCQYSDLNNAVQMSDSLIFTNLKAIFFGKYLSKRAFTASRSPVCRKAEIWKFTEIKGLSVIPSRRTRSSKLLPCGPKTASLTFASAGEPKSERNKTHCEVMDGSHSRRVTKKRTAYSTNILLRRGGIWNLAQTPRKNFKTH